ncbi:MAG: HAD-IB family phosphatase [Gemmatimonadota bacterium]
MSRVPRNRFGTVIFDCDSTLTAIEGIDEIAREHRAEVQLLTEEAMRGRVPLEEVYGRRLELVRPPRGRVLALGQRYVETLVPGAREASAALRAGGVHVRIISGGLKPAVLILARELGVAESAVDAVDVYFDQDGAYSGFDVASPLAASGGKRTVIENLARTVPRPVMLVGDGATDQEAQPVVDEFVAFAGVAFRPAVVAAADFVIRDHSLVQVIELALGTHPKSTQHSNL